MITPENICLELDPRDKSTDTRKMIFNIPSDGALIVDRAFALARGNRRETDEETMIRMAEAFIAWHS